MKYYLILVSILLFSSCAGSKKVVTETKAQLQTLTTLTEIKMDTTLFIPQEKVSLFIPIEQAQIKGYVNPKVYTQRKGRTTVTIKIDSTGIMATSTCDSIIKKVQYYKKQIKELRLELKDTQVTQTEKKGYNLFELILYIVAFSMVSFVAAYLLKTFKII